MATWKRILVEDDIVGEDPISITDGVVSLIDPDGLTNNPKDDVQDQILVYDNTANVWTSLTLESMFGYLTAQLAQSQIDGGGSTTVFAPNGVVGDLNGDGSVNVEDMLIFFSNYGLSGTAAASYYYENQSLTYTTWNANTGTEVLNISGAGTASAAVTTIAVDTGQDTITFSGITNNAANANLDLTVTFLPETYQVQPGLFTFEVYVTWKDQNGNVAGNQNFSPGSINYTATLWGEYYESSSSMTATFPNSLFNSDTGEPPSEIKVQFKVILTGVQNPNVDTHKARINDLNVTYS